MKDIWDQIIEVVNRDPESADIIGKIVGLLILLIFFVLTF